MLDGLIDTTDIRPAGAVQVSETGLHEGSLFKLVLKTLFTRGVETSKQVSDCTMLHIGVVRELLETAKSRALVEILGSVDHNGYSDYRYSLTSQGRERAADALAQCQYVGAAPVALDEYIRQMERQGIRKEIVGKDSFQDHLSHLVMADELKRIIGPGINSGRSMLLYGPPGNGKTSIAVAVAKAFKDHIYLPYAIEVEGEIIKYFDPVIHRRAATRKKMVNPLSEEPDDRPEFTCDRPTVVIGGELTMNMLDLYYSPVGKFYEMPMQMKANGGILVIDDLGRQQCSVTELLNRWIMPMEKHFDYMALQSGATFSVPFDNLLIFSTNLEPADLMDPAFLRRIPYKVHVGYPKIDEFTQAFAAVCKSRQLELTDDGIGEIVRIIQSSLQAAGMPLAFYQAGFIVDQVIEQSRFEGCEPEFTRERLEASLENLSPRRQ